MTKAQKQLDQKTQSLWTGAEWKRIKRLRAKTRSAGYALDFTLSDDRALLNGCYFDAGAAEAVILFIERFCRQSKGIFRGRPLVLLPWQKDKVIRPIFGWKRADGLRRFTEAYVEVAKKNGKSTLASAIALMMACMDGEGGPEIYFAATARDQAGICYREAASMVKRSPGFTSLFKPVRSTKTIFAKGDETTFIRALSSDASSSEGVNSHCLIIDEYHAWKDRDFYEAIKYSGAARQQPLTIIITTAGSSLDSMCGEKHEMTKAITRGDAIIQDFYGVIFGNDPGDDISDPASWDRANPSMDHTIDRERFAQEYHKAKRTPDGLARFKRYRLNIWGDAIDPYLPMQSWDLGSASYSEADLEGLAAYGGLDLAQTQDLTALVWVFPDPAGGDEIRVLPRVWVPEDRVRAVSDSGIAAYNKWVEAGWLRTIPGAVVEYGPISEQLAEDMKRFNLQGLAYDRYNANAVIQAANDLGLLTVEWGQGRSMSAPTKELARLLGKGAILHNNNPLLKWCAGNLVVTTDKNDNVSPTKQNRKKKIDPIVAMIMAIGLYSNLSAENSRSKYEDEGLIVL